MKNSICTLAIAAAFVTAIFMVGCQSPAEKSEKANEKVSDAKQDLKEAETAAANAKIKAADEWKMFKAESQIKIDNNDREIADLRDKAKASGKKMSTQYAKTIAELEAKSKALRTKIETYDTNQSDWEASKREFNHDMDELGQALKDLVTNNKK